MARPNLGTPLQAWQWGLGAAWLYHGEYNAWTWNPLPTVYPHDLDRLNRLTAAGYRQVPTGTGNRELLTLYGQMQELIKLALPGTEAYESWAPDEVLERLERVPVALAFTLPDETSNEITNSVLAVDLERSTPEVPRKYCLMAQWLPPPGFGARALILRKDGTIQTRTIAALGDDARALVERMARKLCDLASPIDWPFWTRHLMACRTQDEYERRRDALRSQLLVRRGQAREEVREALDALDGLRALALSIQAQASRRIHDEHAWRDGIAEVAAMAQQLADMYWQLEQEAVRPLLQQSTLPDIQTIFDGDSGDSVAEVSSMAPVQTIVNSHSAGTKGWTPDPVTGVPTIRQTTPEHDTVIQIRGDDPAELLDEARIAQFWRQVSELSDLDTDVLLIMIAQEFASSAAHNGVWIHAGRILDYRGIKPKTTRDEHGRPRRAGHRREDLLDIAGCVARQSNQWVHINSVILDDLTGNKRKARHTHVSKLTQIMEVVYQDELLPDANAPGAGVLPYAWRYRIGTWLDPWRTEPNRKVAYLCQKTLCYDPYHEKFEKRLAVYFMFNLRFNATTGGALRRRVGELLDARSLPVDERNPERTRRRFDQALDRLVHDGVIESWNYVESNPALPAKGWVATWREWRVNIRANAMTTARLAQIAERTRVRRERAAALGAASKRKRGKDPKSG